MLHINITRAGDTLEATEEAEGLPAGERYVLHRDGEGLYFTVNGTRRALDPYIDKRGDIVAFKKVNLRVLSREKTAQNAKDAARDVFESEGYKAATVRAIASRVGMSTGAIFSNYKDKDDLYRAVYGHDPITPEQGLEMAHLIRALIEQARDSEAATIAGAYLDALPTIRKGEAA